MRILVTGANGRIGGMVTPALVAAGYEVTTFDRTAPAAPVVGARQIIADITDRQAVALAVAGQDAVIHLAAHPTALEWDEIYQPNIVGATNVIEAAGAAGVGRILLASSIHVAGHTRVDARFDAGLPLRPDSPCGVSKVYAEAALRYAHERYGCSGYALRIGTCRERPLTIRERVTWLAPEDFVALTTACLHHAGGGYHTLWGFSANQALDIDRGAWDAVGYHPTRDAEEFMGGLTDIDAGTPGTGLIGGRFVRRGC